MNWQMCICQGSLSAQPSMLAHYVAAHLCNQTTTWCMHVHHITLNVADLLLHAKQKGMGFLPLATTSPQVCACARPISKPHLPTGACGHNAKVCRASVAATSCQGEAGCRLKGEGPIHTCIRMGGYTGYLHSMSRHSTAQHGIAWYSTAW